MDRIGEASLRHGFRALELEPFSDATGSSAPAPALATA
jgi:hypothetical protein